jgi:hypothetical protein
MIHVTGSACHEAFHSALHRRATNSLDSLMGAGELVADVTATELAPFSAGIRLVVWADGNKLHDLTL